MRPAHPVGLGRTLLVAALVAGTVAACRADLSPSPVVPSPTGVGRPTPTASPSPAASASPSPSPTLEATIELTVTATMTERCGSIGGCAAYLIVRPHGGDDWPAIPLLGRGGDGGALPTAIDPGRYTFHFSWRAVSDAIANGQPLSEGILDTCQVEVVAGTFGANPQGIEVVAEFHGATCEAEAFHTVTIID